MGKRKIVSCAACRVQRKKCSEDCVLAPYFPSDDQDKFATVHKIYGTGHIIKLLQAVDAAQRADAVNSLHYEASARVKDPVHGCTTEFLHLQKRIAELEFQLAAAQAKVKRMRSQYDKLLFLGTGTLDSQLIDYPNDFTSQPSEDCMYEEHNLLFWEPLWEE